MSREQRLRAILYHLSLLIFIIGLPFILSSALGFKFNPRTLKFTKTGLIALKTQPAGAKVYLNGKLLNEKTPATIQELLPGNYTVSLELEKHYPWSAEVDVEPRKVTRVEKIILFPLRPNVKQLNKSRISSFWVDQERKRVYYINLEDSSVYSSDLDGERFHAIGVIPGGFSEDITYRISPDKEKLICFDRHKAAVIYLQLDNKVAYMQSHLLLDYFQRRIIDLFWHSDSYHFILVTDKNIEILEAKPKALPVNLVSLNRRNTSSFYDISTDTLYFIDLEKAADGGSYDNIYKLELSPKSYLWDNLIKLKADERVQE